MTTVWYLICFHPADHPLLEQEQLQRDRQVSRSTKKMALSALKASLPPKERRGLVLRSIHRYELKKEYRDVVIQPLLKAV
ncbi:23S rRNA (adenine(2030)-N(6))-methyltransferase RlmJ [Vibrio chagasii]|nr:23S rRNA (adenine(2030)-N(6))-methyltransferase RlmJ [Vibrio chagasii]